MASFNPGWKRLKVKYAFDLFKNGTVEDVSAVESSMERVFTSLSQQTATGERSKVYSDRKHVYILCFQSLPLTEISMTISANTARHHHAEPTTLGLCQRKVYQSRVLVVNNFHL